MLKDLITETRKTHHLGPQGRFKLEEFEVSWRKAGRNQQVASDAKASGMGIATAEAFLIQQVVPGAARIRIVGQQLHDILDMEPRGMSFGALFSDESRETALELLDAAFTLPAIVSLPLIANRGPLRRSIKAEVLLLPLWDPSGATKHLMGTLVMDRVQNLAGVKFDIAHEVPFRCETLDQPNPDRRQTSAKPRLVINNAG